MSEEHARGRRHRRVRRVTRTHNADEAAVVAAASASGNRSADQWGVGAVAAAGRPMTCQRAARAAGRRRGSRGVRRPGQSATCARHRTTAIPGRHTRARAPASLRATPRPPGETFREITRVFRDDSNRRRPAASAAGGPAPQLSRRSSYPAPSSPSTPRNNTDGTEIYHSVSDDGPLYLFTVVCTANVAERPSRTGHVINGKVRQSHALRATHSPLFVYTSCPGVEHGHCDGGVISNPVTVHT